MRENQTAKCLSEVKEKKKAEFWLRNGLTSKIFSRDEKTSGRVYRNATLKDQTYFIANSKPAKTIKQQAHGHTCTL